MCETYLGKKLFYIFLGANFLMPKSSHQCEKQPVLGLGYWVSNTNRSRVPEAYQEASKTSQKEIFVKIVSS